MPDHDLKLLIDAAKASGDIARKYFQADPEVWHKPDDAGPVSAADLAVNAMLEAGLQSARPDYGWLSEETTDGAARLDKEHVFIIDPIDGTRSFLKGDTTWSHSLAIAKSGQITAAVVFLPMLDRLYTATLGNGAFLNGSAMTASVQSDADTADVLATKPTLSDHHWRGGTAPQFTRHHRPSLAYRLSLVAQGRFDAMLTLRPSWEWDIAAGALIAAEAGAVISNQIGDPLEFNNPDPRLNGIVCGSPGIHADLLRRLAPQTSET